MYASATVACVVAAWALVEMGRAMRSLRRAADNADERLKPLLDKADVTVDAINVELLRIDAIVTRFERAGERASAASDTLSGIVAAPTEIVNEVALRVRRAWRERRSTPAAGAESKADRSPDAYGAGETEDVTGGPTGAEEGEDHG